MPSDKQFQFVIDLHAKLDKRELQRMSDAMGILIVFSKWFHHNSYFTVVRMICSHYCSGTIVPKSDLIAPDCCARTTHRIRMPIQDPTGIRLSQQVTYRSLMCHHTNWIEACILSRSKERSSELSTSSVLIVSQNWFKGRFIVFAHCQTKILNMSTNREFLATYLIKELLGKGAFGSVWKAEDSNTNLEVAVKVIDRR